MMDSSGVSGPAQLRRRSSATKFGVGLGATLLVVALLFGTVPSAHASGEAELAHYLDDFSRLGTTHDTPY